MYTCRICRWLVNLDDVVLKFTNGEAICVTCYARETQTDKPMSAAVKRDVVRAVEEAP